MSSILLIGNGFTSCLIPTYKNEHMMSKVKEVAPEIFKKADDLFTPFRKKTEPLLYDARAAGYCGQSVCGGTNFGGSYFGFAL